MWINIFFILNTLETVALFIYTLAEKSHPQEVIFLNYSADRLVLLCLILLCVCLFAFLGLHSFLTKSKIHDLIERIFHNESVHWIVIWISVIVSITVYYVLIQPESWFGAYLMAFQRMRVFLFWLLLLCVQIMFFSLVWYGVNFIEHRGGQGLKLTIGEMDAVMIIFALSIIAKIIFIIPNSYGLFKDVGESKYFNMISYLFEGRYIHEADDITLHYPFLYPLFLIFTFFIKNYTFQAILVANSFFASSIVFPLYLVARRILDKRSSLILIILGSIIPFQFLMSNRILSENLYFPLFLWSVYLVFVRPDKFRYRLCWDLLTGFSFGLLYLTRFISLAIMPILMFVWWMKPFKDARGFFRLDLKKSMHAILILLITALVYTPWFWIARNNGLSVGQALGFGIAARTNPEQLTIGNLVIWIILYLAYYILLAAPVLNLLVCLCRAINYEKWKDERSRWLWALTLLLLAFLIAVVRHSWRAFYNLEQPSKIMGRYVIYFVPLFLMTGLLGLKTFNRENFKSFRQFIFLVCLLPLVVVALSYDVLLGGQFINTDASFIQPLISINVYAVELMGPVFWVLITALYGVGAWLLWQGRQGAQIFISCLLVLYFLWAQPAYFEYLETQSSYQRLGYALTERILEANTNTGKMPVYTIYLSDGLDLNDRKDLIWSMYVRNLESELIFVYYPTADQPVLIERPGFVVYPDGELQEGHSGSVYVVNGQKILIETYMSRLH